MGYTTDFFGSIEISPALPAHVVEYINRFGQSRRMARNVTALLAAYPNVEQYGYPGPMGWSYGEDGEYFVCPDSGDGPRETIVDYNRPPRTQPGLWCQWIITEDGTQIEWDQGEKFYESADWMQYIIDNFIAPYGCKCNGEIEAQGEDHDDTWSLVVTDNVVAIKDRSSYAFDQTEKAFGAVMGEIDSIVKRIDYENHMEELIATATPAQLDLLTEIRRRLTDVYERNKSFLEG